MAPSTWKAVELEVCRLLGGQRRGPTGVACSDCIDAPFCVSVKHGKRATPEARWLADAKALGKAEGLPWLLVCHPFRAPVRTSYAVLELGALLELRA